MNPPPSARLLAAPVALFAALISASVCAHAQLPQPDFRHTEEAFASLPDAPVPQNSKDSTSAAGQAASGASTSSSSQENPPAASAPPVGTAPPAGTEPSPAATPGTPPGQVADPSSKQSSHDEAERELKAEEKQRLLGVMPQFQVVMGGQAVALTGGQKWRLALHSAIDPFYIGWALVIGGGYGEIVGSHPGYGWGADGYLKRVGATYADNVNGALIGNALLPQLLHQDPRYFRKGTGSIKRRFLYAAESTVVCHGDNGKNQANVSNVLGNFISGAISNAYYPASERGVSLTLENGLSVTLFGALGGQLLEFGPDIAKLIHHKKQPAATPGPMPASPAALSPNPAPPATNPSR